MIRQYRCPACKITVFSTVSLEECPNCEDKLVLAHPLLNPPNTVISGQDKKSESKRKYREAQRKEKEIKGQKFTDEALDAEVARSMPDIIAGLERRLRAETEMDKYDQ